MRRSILALVALGSASGFLVGMKVSRSQSGPEAPPAVTLAAVAVPKTSGASLQAPLLVPRATTPIKIDGEPDDPAWTANELLRTPAYSARPYSDARFTLRDGNLYVLLYAADEDVNAAQVSHNSLWTSDAMRVILSPRKDGPEYVVEVSPAGALTDYTRNAAGVSDASWESGAQVGIDLDGTVNESSNTDEEWVAELSIPLASLGALEPPSTLGVRVERMDVSKGAADGLMSWTPPGGRVMLAP